jgi:hypothetical protein
MEVEKDQDIDEEYIGRMNKGKPTSNIQKLSLSNSRMIYDTKMLMSSVG